MTRPAVRSVKTRRVFYIPGFDPFPSRRYRELFRTEGKAQAQISGYDLSMKADGPGWRTTYQNRGDDHSVITQFRVLSWSDVVKSQMHGGPFRLLGKLCRTAWIYARSGAYRRLWSLRRGPVLSVVYPVFGFLIQLMIIAALSAVAGYAASSVIGMSGWAVSLIAWPLWRACVQLDRRLYIHYLLHDFAASAEHEGAVSPKMAARIDEFRTQIEEALLSDVDEVLIVGHSSGAHIAALTLAPFAQNETGKLGFVSLGHVFPMLGLLRRADALRTAVRQLGQGNIPWVDVSSLADGCAFALCHPVSVITSCKDTKWPLVFSAAFGKSVSPKRLAAMRWRFFRKHFQYLCAFDRPEYFDYFALTCGSRSLWDRYQSRAPSKSVIMHVARGVRYD